MRGLSETAVLALGLTVLGARRVLAQESFDEVEVDALRARSEADAHLKARDVWDELFGSSSSATTTTTSSSTTTSTPAPTTTSSDHGDLGLIKVMDSGASSTTTPSPATTTASTTTTKSRKHHKAHTTKTHTGKLSSATEKAKEKADEAKQKAKSVVSGNSTNKAKTSNGVSSTSAQQSWVTLSALLMVGTGAFMYL